MDEAKAGVSSFMKEHFGMGEPDSYEISGFTNFDGDDITSSEIFFHITYGSEEVTVDWNINTKQVTGFAGRGLLEKMR